jgi:hypothetical protein
MLASEPVAPAASVAVMEKVVLAPTGRSTVALMLPVPDAGHVAPPADVHVHVAPLSAAASTSVTLEEGAAEGPLFVATIV